MSASICVTKLDNTQTVEDFMDVEAALQWFEDHETEYLSWDYLVEEVEDELIEY